MLHHGAVVDVIMIGCNEDYIVAADRIGRKGYREPSSKCRVIPCRWNHGHERIVVVHARSASFDEFDELERGTLSHILNILLISKAENENTRASESFAQATIDRLRQFGNNQIGHSRIDFTSEFDKASRDVIFARSPGKIEGVNWNAVAPETWSGIERHEAERFGFCRFDHFPDVDAHGGENSLELVYQGDVDGSKDIFGELNGFSGFQRGDRNCPLHDTGVESIGQRQCHLVIPADNLRNVFRAKFLIAWILAFGRKYQIKILSTLPSRLLELWLHHVPRGARIGGRFENNQLTLAQPLGNLSCRVDHEGQVWLTMLGERGRHCDEDGVLLRKPIKVCSDFEPAATDRRTQLGR